MRLLAITHVCLVEVLLCTFFMGILLQGRGNHGVVDAQAGLADWAEPKAGMFMWVKLRGYTDAAQILSELQDAKVIVVPGEQSC